MTSQINYVIAQQRIAELRAAAESARLAATARQAAATGGQARLITRFRARLVTALAP